PARPKVAAYPFTTLSPALGTAVHQGKRIVIADIPGLIQDAHAGVGLGTRFLRHIQRTRALVYLVSADREDPFKPWKDFETTRNEIGLHDELLLQKRSLLVLNKIDLLTDAEIRANVEEIQKHGWNPVAISAKTKRHIKLFWRALFKVFS
ncbi:MAG TPA: GTPase, partial [Bdellovibrionota bacterium]|nr:GTPase [Bdellovibrionota bacterium]